MSETPSGYLLSTGRELEGDLSCDPYLKLWDDNYGEWTLKFTLTPEEKEEIAEYAINEWKKWANK